MNIVFIIYAIISTISSVSQQNPQTDHVSIIQSEIRILESVNQTSSLDGSIIQQNNITQQLKNESVTASTISQNATSNDEDETAKDNTNQEETPEETDEEREERQQKEQYEANEQVKKDYMNKYDQSDDFKVDQMDKYLSGLKNDDLNSDQIYAELEKLKKTGPILELLEPKAREFSNIPQSKKVSKRLNCIANDGSFKSHFLTSQSSKNYIQWRVKRSAKNGNCTIRVSTDGENFIPLTPTGFKQQKFACARKSGYESVEIVLPKSVVSETGAVMQLELENEFGVIIQCSDIIVQRLNLYQPQKCEPHCKNGGVCQNGQCKCGKMFSGNICETKIEASGSLSLLLFIFVIGLGITGIALLYQRDIYRKEMKQYWDSMQQNKVQDNDPQFRNMQNVTGQPINAAPNSARVNSARQQVRQQAYQEEEEYDD